MIPVGVAAALPATMPDVISIRTMRPDDVGPAAEAVLRGQWSDRRAWFAFATSQPACVPLVAVDEGAIVGTGVGTANGTVGWVGTIYVVPELRRRGLGRALTQAVLEALEPRGCRTFLLVASDAGRPLYERMGFEVQTHYRILEAPGLEAPELEGPALEGPGAQVDDTDVRWVVRRFEPADLEPMIALDRRATGEDREHVLRRFADPSSTKALRTRDGGELRGFVVRAPWGGGATIAEETGAALAILEERRRASGPGGRVRVGLLEENAEGLEALDRLGLTPVWSAPRMIRGEPFPWRPEWIWGQFNHAIG